MEAAVGRGCGFLCGGPGAPAWVQAAGPFAGALKALPVPSALALAALEADAPLRVCNLGSGRGYSVREVVAAVERVTGLPVPCKAAGRRPGDPAELLASSARARSELGWEPEYGELDVIVETAWRWHRSHPAGYAS